MPIHHVALECPADRSEDAAEFYELLGFRRVNPPPTLADRALWLQSGPTQIHLLFTDKPVTPPEGHVAVVADDFDAAVAALLAAGHAIDERPRHWGSPRAFVRDPVGNLVEVMRFPPGED